MSENVTLAELESRLQHKTIHEIRQIARALGVSRPADGKKERLIGDLMKICSGELAPAPRATRGAPPKSEAYDRFFVADFERCRAELIAERGGQPAAKLASGENPTDTLYEGVLYTDGKGFYLTGFSSWDGSSDIAVPDTAVRRFNLREGDLIKCTVTRGGELRRSNLVSVLTVNGGVPESALNRPDFGKLAVSYPTEKISLSSAGAEGKIIDLFAPFAAGRRGIVVGAPNCGATSVLLSICGALSARGTQVVCLLVGARPEEIEDFGSVGGVKTFATAFDRPDGERARSAYLALEYCKRQAEYGRDVALVVDNANRLARAFCSQSEEGDGSAGVLRLFSAAKAGEGSLSVIAAVSLSSVPSDVALYTVMRDACNMQITLSEKLAADGVFPAIDGAASSSARAEKFCPADEIALSAAARRLDGKTVVKAACACRTFEQFKQKIKEYVG